MSLKTKAFVNFYAGIGVLEKFVELDPWAKSIADQHNLSVWFNVKDGPNGLLTFSNGRVSATEYSRGDACDVRLYFKSCELFNDVVDGKAAGSPLPLKGIFKTLKFMGKPDSPFNVLTNEMANIMRQGKRCNGESVNELSTQLAFYAMAAGLAQVGNHDRIAKIAAARIHDGEISVEIKDVAAATVIASGGKLKCALKKSENPRAFMIFDNLDIAGKLIRGEVDAMSCLSSGLLVMKGFIPMLDDLNKILNIVPKYLS
ncbi:MAG: hypothetical protein LBE09_01435 [Christensenellaceae bacterium]|jgi:hypothetical protein|nr:hypothetical protein [Christensenellaceae bacterium]